MYYRRKLLLAILERSKHKKLSKITLQKVLFLIGKEQEQPYFDFVPYKYGCFSFQANKDLEVLSSHFAVIENKEKEWSLLINQNYFENLKRRDKNIINQIFKTLDVENTSDLIESVYDDYPYFTINSERKLTVSQESKRQQEREKIRNDKKQLFSIGYEKRSIDAYLNLLVKYNVKLLCDVRKNPFSMKYGFSKNQLRVYCCDKLNIKYIHIPDLGIKSQLRKNLNTKKDYESIFKSYQKELINKHENLKYLKEVFKKYNRMAFMCFERDHNFCHRNMLIDYYNKKFEPVSPIHL